MRTILVISKTAGFSEALRHALDPEAYRLLAKEHPFEAEELLLKRMIDAVLLEADLVDVRPIKTIQQLRAICACPLVVFAADKQWEFEEQAYLEGATHVLAKPVRAELLNTLLARFWVAQPAAVLPPENGGRKEQKSADQPAKPFQSLEVMRDFSGLLSHSLCADALLREYLLMLREIIGVNRAAIFLRKPAGPFGRGVSLWADRRLRSVCGIGLPQDLLQHFELSLDAGIGGHVYRQGRILRAESEEAGRNREIQKEFELLGAQIAIPVLDRESLIGVAVFGGRLTEEPFTNEELALIFHLLEELGLAVKNSWLHDELSANHQVMADILNQLGSGCIVIGPNLDVLQTNPAARHLLRFRRNAEDPLEFSDLPQGIGSKVFESIKSGVAVPAFNFTPPELPEVVYQVSVTPFKRAESVALQPVLLLIEDVSHQQKARALELENAGVRMIKSMAEHLAHEIGNSVVPLSTCEQLMREASPSSMDVEFARSLGHSLKRIMRLSQQMIFLAREKPGAIKPVGLIDLCHRALQGAREHSEPKEVKFEESFETGKMKLAGDLAGLQHALTEIFLNAIQAHSAPVIKVRGFQEKDRKGGSGLRLIIEDNGEGFLPEVAAKAMEAFYSTRKVGLGLGLTVAHKIVQLHGGKLEIDAHTPSSGGRISIWLPSERHENGEFSTEE